MGLRHEEGRLVWICAGGFEVLAIAVADFGHVDAEEVAAVFVEDVVEGNGDCVFVHGERHVGRELLRDGGVSPEDDWHEGERLLSGCGGRDVKFSDFVGDGQSHGDGVSTRDAPADGLLGFWYFEHLRVDGFVELFDEFCKGEGEAAGVWGVEVVVDVGARRGVAHESVCYTPGGAAVSALQVVGREVFEAKGARVLVVAGVDLDLRRVVFTGHVLVDSLFSKTTKDATHDGTF